MSEETTEYTTIVRNITPERWAEVFAASARKARETYFRRHGIKKPKKGLKLNRTGDAEARVMSLFEVLQEKEDEEMVEEIIRVYLLSKRGLLAAALDYLGIEHDDGLTESDKVDKIKSMKGKELDGLCAALLEQYPKQDVELYLRFMGSREVDRALKSK